MEYFIQGYVVFDDVTPKEVSSLFRLLKCFDEALGRLEVNITQEGLKYAAEGIRDDVYERGSGRKLRDSTVDLLKDALDVGLDEGDTTIGEIIRIDKESRIAVGDNRFFRTELVSRVARAVLVEFDLPPVYFSFARTASGFDPFGFGGGSCVVSQEGIQWFDPESDIHQTVPEDLAGAAHSGRFDLVEQMIAAGADVNANGGRAILWAARAERLDMVKFLFEHGADPKTDGLATIATPQIESVRQSWMLHRMLESNDIPDVSGLKRARAHG